MQRLLQGLWVPMVATLATIGLIVAIGELLLRAGEPEVFSFANTPVRLAVVIALVVAVVVLLGSTLLAGGEKKGK